MTDPWEVDVYFPTFHGKMLQNHHFPGSMGLVYVPTWTVDFYGFSCR